MMAPTRRSLLGGAAVLAATPAAGAPARPDPDTDLVRLGRLLDEAVAREHAAWKVVPQGSADDDPEMTHACDLCDQTSEIVRQIAPIAALTVAGAMVKVRALNWCRDWEAFDAAEFAHPMATPPSRDAVLIAGLLTDLTAMEAGTLERPIG